MTSRRPIVTIDGPAGAGKSTVARLLARELGFRFLDTGAMYRVVAWKAARRGLTDLAAIARMIRETRVEIGEQRVTCDGEDVTAVIRTPEVTATVRPIADDPGCREAIGGMQREFGREGGLVTEGRDQGSVVFADAEHKFYLDASLEERARRRAAETGGDFHEIRSAIDRRDAADRSRPVGRLACPKGAAVVDTSGLTVPEVVARIRRLIGSA